MCWPAKRLPAWLSWLGFRTTCLRAGASPWCGSKQARAPGQVFWNRACPPRSSPGSCEEEPFMAGVMIGIGPAQGLAHGGGDRGCRGAARAAAGARQRRAGGAAAGLGRGLAGAHVGGRGGRRPGAPAGPAAAVRRGAGLGRAAQAGCPGPAAGHREREQERPRRRPVGRRRRAALARGLAGANPRPSSSPRITIPLRVLENADSVSRRGLGSPPGPFFTSTSAISVPSTRKLAGPGRSSRIRLAGRGVGAVEEDVRAVRVISRDEPAGGRLDRRCVGDA